MHVYNFGIVLALLWIEESHSPTHNATKPKIDKAGNALESNVENAAFTEWVKFGNFATFATLSTFLDSIDLVSQADIDAAEWIRELACPNEYAGIASIIINAGHYEEQIPLTGGDVRTALKTTYAKFNNCMRNVNGEIHSHGKNRYDDRSYHLCAYEATIHYASALKAEVIRAIKIYEEIDQLETELKKIIDALDQQSKTKANSMYSEYVHWFLHSR